jgi:AcrR family transcriptional regulator
VGVKERQEREREATTRAILDAARELFVAEGYQNVSIRKIAEKIEYSPAAIYSYFASKDDIFLALAEEGFRLLFQSADECACSAEPDAPPIECIRNAFLDIYNFSKAHPEYHALMFMDRSVPKISQDWQRFGFVREMRTQLTRRIQQAIDRGDFPKDSSVEAIFRVLMVSTLGVCMVRLCERMAPGEDADALARVTIDAVITGFRTGFSHSYRPDTYL